MAQSQMSGTTALRSTAQAAHFPLATFPIAEPYSGNHWCTDEYDALDARLCDLLIVMRSADAEARAYDRECLATLGSVRDALHALNLVVLGTDLEASAGTASSLMAYLSAAYAWCGDVVDDLHALAEHGSSKSREERRCEIAGSATAYVADFIEPLFGRLNEPNGPLSVGHPLHRIRAQVERLESEIVSLSWELGPGLCPREELPTTH